MPQNRVNPIKLLPTRMTNTYKTRTDNKHNYKCGKFTSAKDFY